MANEGNNQNTPNPSDVSSEVASAPALTAAKAIATDDLQEKRTESDALIKRYALLGTASGLIPIFGLDVAAATAIQTKMIKDIADVYEMDIDDQLIRMAITTGITALAGRIITEAASMLAGSIAPLKMFVNGATSAAVSGFLTIEIGKLYQSKMELGQNPADVSFMEIVDHVVAQIKEGKWNPSDLSLTKQLGAMVQN